MRQFTLHATRALAVVAIAAMPAVAPAQTSQAAASQPNPAAEHLGAARNALNKVLNTPAPAGDTFKKLSDLKTEYIALEKAASTASPQWTAHYSAIDRILADMLGGSTVSAEPGAVGTSGRKGAPASKALDASLAANLQEFRTHLAAFSSAMSAVAPAPPAATVDPPVTATTVSATPAAVPPADTGVAALLDSATALVDSALAANAQATTISVDRSTLEQLKSQLEQIKQQMKKP